MNNRHRTSPRRAAAALALGTAVAVGVPMLSAGSALAAERHMPRAVSASVGESACRLSTQAQDVVATLNTLTQVMQNVQSSAAQINATSAITAAVGIGPVATAIVGLNGATSLQTQAVEQFNMTKPFTDVCDATAVLAAYKAYAQVAQQTFATLIGKSSLLAHVPSVSAAISASLRVFGSVDDALAYSVIELATSETAQVETAAASLSATLSTATDVYTEISL